MSSSRCSLAAVASGVSARVNAESTVRRSGAVRVRVIHEETPVLGVTGVEREAEQAFFVVIARNGQPQEDGRALDVLPALEDPDDAALSDDVAPRAVAGGVAEPDGAGESAARGRRRRW
jgi:hypothetical protein